MDIEMVDGDGIPTPQSEPSRNDGNILPFSSLSSKAQASLQSCREETDFDSYYAFLRFHSSKDGDEFWTPADEDKELGYLSDDLFRCQNPTTWLRTPSDLGSRVLNISKDCKVSMSAPHSDVHQTNIIEALCDPKDAQLQIAVWSLSSREHMMAQTDLIDYLGLHFSLDPRYFMAVRNLIREVEFMTVINSSREVERGAFASADN